MTDKLDSRQRSINMAKIHSTNTSIEVKVRKFLFSEGFRYRKNVSSLPGKPDLVLKKYKTVIFVNGCFWHRHTGCKRATVPKTRTDYWVAKFDKNIENDLNNYQQLRASGWKVIIIWECDILRHFSTTMLKTIEEILSN